MVASSSTMRCKEGVRIIAYHVQHCNRALSICICIFELPPPLYLPSFHLLTLSKHCFSLSLTLMSLTLVYCVCNSNKIVEAHSQCSLVASLHWLHATTWKHLPMVIVFCMHFMWPILWSTMATSSCNFYTYWGKCLADTSIGQPWYSIVIFYHHLHWHLTCFNHWTKSRISCTCICVLLSCCRDPSHIGSTPILPLASIVCAPLANTSLRKTSSLGRHG